MNINSTTTTTQIPPQSTKKPTKHKIEITVDAPLGPHSIFINPENNNEVCAAQGEGIHYIYKDMTGLKTADNEFPETISYEELHQKIPLQKTKQATK